MFDTKCVTIVEATLTRVVIEGKHLESKHNFSLKWCLKTTQGAAYEKLLPILVSMKQPFATFRAVNLSNTFVAARLHKNCLKQRKKIEYRLRTYEKINYKRTQIS